MNDASRMHVDSALARGWAGTSRKVALLGVLGLTLSVTLGLLEGDGLQRLQFAHLTAVLFCLGPALGALFFVLLQHLVRAGWSVAVRRIAELVASALPVLALLLLPLVLAAALGHGGLFSWADVHSGDAAHAGHAAHLVEHKRPYLNGPFFLLRWGGYALVWTLLARWFLQRSVQQDFTGDPQLTLRMQRRAAPGMLLFALTVTFAAFDYVMSLTPEWFSTILGVYLFAGAAVGFLALLPLLLVRLQRSGPLAGVVTVEHYHDVGKLLFAFVFFWGYIAFSQYVLIWYADLPEETGWFAVRQNSGWRGLSLLLVVGHFLLPFAALLGRGVKRAPRALAAWGAFLLAMHFVDVFWLVAPTRTPAAPQLGLLELASVVGVAALAASRVLHHAEGRALVPVRDPRLAESLAFHNV